MLLADTKQKVIDILNASNLPIDAIYYVMKEVMVDVESTYNRVLQEEENAKAQARADAERPTTKEEAEALNKKLAKENEKNKEEKK